MNPTQDPHIKGYYLSADVAHDFGADTLRETPYNHGGPDANTKVPPKGTNPKLDEDAAVEYIEEKAINGDQTEFIENGQARRSKRIVFTIPTKTSTFKESSVPVLFEGGNSQIGIVQDAGKFITIDLGAKNVLTFGSILDPAGKPIDKVDNPIWYSPVPVSKAETAGITIPLQHFGFDTRMISSIQVANMRAGTVSSAFLLQDGRVLDAVSMKPLAPGTKPASKPINNTKIEKAGFYTSINQANNSALNPDARDAIRNGFGYLFNVGKTLGDLALVASCMPGFRGGSSNVYYGIGAGPASSRDGPGWLNWSTGEPEAPPSILMLKTGDRLNALRAQMENVPNILEQQAGKGRTVKQYVFTPGKADPNAIIQALDRGYKELISSATTRYNTLIQNFNNCLLPDGSLNPAFTVFTETPVIKSTDVAGLQAAGLLVRSINVYLNRLRDIIVEWLSAHVKTISEAIPMIKTLPVEQAIEQIEKIQTQYNSDVETVTRVTPQTTDVIYTKRGTRKVMLKIIVSQLPKTIPPNFSCPLRVSLDISLWNAFSKLQNGGGVNGMKSLFGTDFHKRFVLPLESILPPPPGSPFEQLTTLKGGGPREDYLAAVAQEEESQLEEFVAVNSRHELAGGGPQKGGVVYIDVDSTNLDTQYPTLESVKDTFPLIGSFWEYMAATLNITDRKELLIGCYSVYLGKESGTIIDDEFLNKFLIDFDRLYSINPYTGESFVMFRGGKYIPAGYSTGGVDIFNAFTCRTNFENALEFGFIGPIPEEPDDNTEPVLATQEEVATSGGVMFARLERKFIERARTDIGALIERAGGQQKIQFKRGSIQSSKGSFGETVKLPESPEAGMEMSSMGGSLRGRRPLYSNVPVPRIARSESDKHPRLRKRARTRRTSRVRQSTRKSKTRR
jgi:hypothetical protein